MGACRQIRTTNAVEAAPKERESERREREKYEGRGELTQDSQLLFWQLSLAGRLFGAHGVSSDEYGLYYSGTEKGGRRCSVKLDQWPQEQARGRFLPLLGAVRRTGKLRQELVEDETRR